MSFSQIGNYLSNVATKHRTRVRYYDTHSFTQCVEESARILARYPDRIPVLVEQADSSRLPDIDKIKFLVPYDMTIGQFISVIRRRISLSPEMGLFLFIGQILPNGGQYMRDLYKEYKDERGFLHIQYSGENVFG